MLLGQNLPREDSCFVDWVLAALLPLLFLYSNARFVWVLAFEVILCPLDAALGSLLLLFEFLQHGLDPFMLVVGVSSLLCIVLPNLLVAL